MTAEEQDRIERQRARLESMSDAEVDKYLAEREEADRVAEVKRRRREHFLHRLGIALVWLSTLSTAYWFGYSQNRSLTHTPAEVSVWVEVGLLFLGLYLWATNRHRRERD